MSLTQNEKICQVTEESIVIGVDIASEAHWARAFDWRGLELGTVISFANSAEGFAQFKAWAEAVALKAEKRSVLVGAEPTGHYWFGLAGFLQSRGMKLVLVNPLHVKRTKELDDRHPSKSDRKDPKTIAKLVLEGRYCEPYLPEGDYAELRIYMNLRWQVQKALVTGKNRIQRWLKIYFPEYSEIFGSFTGKGSMALLHKAPMPKDLVALGETGINQIWRTLKLRAVGKKRAALAFEAARRSIGCTQGEEAARLELRLLLEDYDAKVLQEKQLMEQVEKVCSRIPEVQQLLQIPGVALLTVAGVLAETGDLHRFDSPKQVQNLAGLAITENSSGKHRGQTGISRRGRCRLRKVLFLAGLSVVNSNEEFRQLHRYYTNREKNPLKKKQSIVAVSCKLIRVMYAIATKGCAYSAEKLLADIRRNQPAKAA